MTAYIGKNSKYYAKGSEEDGAFKHVYEAAGLDGNHGSSNFGTGGGDPIDNTATPSSGYVDEYLREWDFTGIHNVPYTDYKINPTDGDAADIYWSTVPKFADLTGDEIPSIPDQVRLLSVDCAAQTVTARSHLAGDYNFHRTDVQPADYVNWTGDVKITSPGTPVDMTYDGPTDTWTGSLSAACVTDDVVTVTSYIGAGGPANGSVSFLVP